MSTKPQSLADELARYAEEYIRDEELDSIEHAGLVKGFEQILGRRVLYERNIRAAPPKDTRPTPVKLTIKHVPRARVIELLRGGYSLVVPWENAAVGTSSRVAHLYNPEGVLCSREAVCQHRTFKSLKSAGLIVLREDTRPLVTQRHRWFWNGKKITKGKK